MVTEKLTFKMDDVVKHNGDSAEKVTAVETPFINLEATDPVLLSHISSTADEGSLINSPANVSILSDEMYSEGEERNKQYQHPEKQNTGDMHRNDYFLSETNRTARQESALPHGAAIDDGRLLELPQAPSLESGTYSFEHHPFVEAFGSIAGSRTGRGMVPCLAESEASHARPGTPPGQHSIIPYGGSRDPLVDEPHFGLNIHDPVNTLYECDSNNPFGLHIKSKVKTSNSFEDINADSTLQHQQTPSAATQGCDNLPPYSTSHIRGNEGYHIAPPASYYLPSYDYGGWSHTQHYHQRSDYRGRYEVDRDPSAIYPSSSAYREQTRPFGSRTFPVQDMRQGVGRLKNPPPAATLGVTESNRAPSNQPLSTNSTSSSSSSFPKNSSPQVKKRQRKSEPTEMKQTVKKRQRTSLRVSSKLTAKSITKQEGATKRVARGSTKKSTKAENARSSAAVSQQGSRSDHTELPLYKPSNREMMEARTPRKQKAVESWYDRLNDLIEYKQKIGDTNVPQKYEANRALGIWVNKQRMEKKQLDYGEKTALTPFRVKLLEQVGFVWAKKKGEHAWQQRFDELVEYRRQHGHCNVPTKNSSQKALGRWVSTQRSMYKKYLDGRIEKDIEEHEKRIRKLSTLNFCWSLAHGSPNSDGIDEENPSAFSFPSIVKQPNNLLNVDEEELDDDDGCEEEKEGDVFSEDGFDEKHENDDHDDEVEGDEEEDEEEEDEEDELQSFEIDEPDDEDCVDDDIDSDRDDGYLGEGASFAIEV